MWYDAHKLKKIRKQHGSPNQDLPADAIGCKRSNFSKLENSATITIRQLTDLAKFYKIDLSELFEFSGEETIFKTKGGDTMLLEKRIAKLEGDVQWHKQIIDKLMTTKHPVEGSD